MKEFNNKEHFTYGKNRKRRNRRRHGRNRKFEKAVKMSFMDKLKKTVKDVLNKLSWRFFCNKES